MNILYIASVRIPNEKASGLAIMRQCEAFAKMRNEVTLLRPFRKNHITEDAFDYYGVEKIFHVHTMHSIDFYACLGTFGFYLARLSQMVAVLHYVVSKRNTIDVIYTRDPWMVLLPLLLHSKKKIVCEAHKTYNNVFVHFVVQRAQLVVCITEGLKTHYRERTKREDIVVEPSGVHLEQFRNTNSIEGVREKFNLPQDKKIFGYIGKYKTMGEEKGVDDVIRAFAKLRESGHDAHLLIVGLEPSEVLLLESMCLNLNLTKDDCTFLPLLQKDFALYVQSVDFLVMNYPNTEHYRNFMSPTKLFAYIASGKLVITTDLPSVREIVDESMVLFVKPGDQESLQKAMMLACENENQFEQMKQRALVQVQRFSWNVRAKRILEKLVYIK